MKMVILISVSGGGRGSDENYLNLHGSNEKDFEDRSFTELVL